MARVLWLGFCWFNHEGREGREADAPAEVGLPACLLCQGGALGFAYAYEYEYAYDGFASVKSLSFMERRRPAADVELWGQLATLLLCRKRVVP